MSALRSHYQTLALGIIAVLGLGLVFALWPYATGLVGGPVLFVMFRGMFRRLSRWMPGSLAAAVVVIVAVGVLVLPGLAVAGMVVGEADAAIQRIADNQYAARIAELQIAGVDIGPRLVSLGEAALAWLGSSALGIVGAAARGALNITIALFGLYFLLLGSDRSWVALSPYIPFNETNTTALRKRFRDVTNSTLIGTGLIAVAQGLLMGVAFAILGLPSAFFWGVVTAVVSILPVVGSGLVWVPATIVLVLSERYVAAVVLTIAGLVIVGGVDNVIRPIVYNRWAQIHPIVTLVGALAGIRFFGILGLLIGPLALSYFFELIAMYREEYLVEGEPSIATNLTGEPIGAVPPGLA